MKILKRLLSCCLVAIMMLSRVSAFATYESNMNMETQVYETDTTITAVTVDYGLGLELTSTYDIDSKTINSTYTNINTGEEISSITYEVETSVPQISVNSVEIEKSTDLNYKYIIRRSNEWYLQRPKLEDEGTGAYYFCTDRNDSNRDYLEDFRNAVDDLADKEEILASKTSDYNMNIFITALLTAAIAIPGAGGIFTALAVSNALQLSGLELDAAEAAQDVADAGNVCFIAIEDVYYNTDNMYFDW